MKKVSSLALLTGIALILKTLLFLCPEQMPVLTAAHNRCQSEAAFAAGKKILFKNTTLYDLELIPGISSATGLRLLADKEKILLKASSLSFEEKKQVFTIVKGIGNKTASILSDYLYL